MRPSRPVYRAPHVFEADPIEAMAHVAMAKWGLENNAQAKHIFENGFREILQAGRTFLNAAARFEQTTDHRITDNGTPPRIFNSEMENLLRSKIPDDVRSKLEVLVKLDIAKAQAALDLIQQLQAFIVANPDAPRIDTSKITTPAPLTVNTIALRMTGSVIVAVIARIKDTHHAEINYSKNPWTATDTKFVKIPAAAAPT